MAKRDLYLSNTPVEEALSWYLTALVAGESADAGMGILAAARALGLEFIEVGQEQYDFALHAEDLELPAVQAFREVIRSPEFQQTLEKWGGYACPDTGRIVKL